MYGYGFEIKTSFTTQWAIIAKGTQAQAPTTLMAVGRGGMAFDANVIQRVRELLPLHGYISKTHSIGGVQEMFATPSRPCVPSIQNARPDVVWRRSTRDS